MNWQQIRAAIAKFFLPCNVFKSRATDHPKLIKL